MVRSCAPENLEIPGLVSSFCAFVPTDETIPE